MTAKTRRFDHFTVRDLIEDVPPLEIIDAKAPVSEALAKMCTNNYSQLPVVQDRTCTGAVTLESIIHLLRKENQRGNRGLSFMDWPVERFMEKNTRFVNPDDDILKHVEWMAEKGFVLVNSPQGLKSIITNYDLVRFFKDKTEVFLLLREIETSLRHLISQCLEEKKLRKTLVLFRRERGAQKSSIEDLTLDELRQLILKNWKDFKDTFQDQKKIDTQLQKVRDFRNQIFHFRAQITSSELASIRRLRDIYLNLASNLADR